ncbi:MAG: M6 family metalloprotease domain-containing protein [Candidatus Thorarchaeota archaeon]
MPRLSMYVAILVVVTIAMPPMLIATSPVLAPTTSTSRSDTNKSGPHLTAVAPMSPEIEYSGDPGGAYFPEPQRAPTGPQTLIAILVYFSDVAYTESRSTLNSIIFENVSDYYEEVSYGQSAITGAVSDWYNLDVSKAYYGADGDTSQVIDDTDDDGDNDSWRLVDDALAAADPYIDFSSYGHIMVVHSGNGQESSGTADDIWSVRWSWPGHFRTNEKTFDSCSIVPEFQGGNVNRSIGVIAHEFGHDIGLPDLYHYGKSGGDDLVGLWGLMASGSWGGSPSGTVPTHMTAYSKLMLDWYADGEVYDLVSGSYEAALTSSYNQTSGLRVIRYNVTETYYYLVEARYQSGYDSSISENGVLITRVDSTKGSGQGIVQVRADSIYDLSVGSWAPGQEFVDEVAGFAVEVLSQEGTSFRVRVRTDPLDGWLHEFALSSNDYSDYRSPVMATNSLGALYCAYVLWDSSISQYTIHVKTSDNGGYSWSKAFDFYSSSSSYINPSIAIDPYDDTIYIIFESTDGDTHNVLLARYYSDHTLWSISTVATNARDPSIAFEQVYGSGNYVMIAFEEWTGSRSSVIRTQVSTDHGASWISRISVSIATFNLQPEIVGSYGFDGIQRWHLVFVGGNTITNTTKIVASRSSNYYGSQNGWTITFSTTISHPTVTAIRGSPEVYYAWTVNSYETTPSYLHDIYIWYSTDHGESLSSNLTLMYTTDDEKVPKLASDNQDNARYGKGVVYLTYFNGDNVCVRRTYYDRPNVLGKEEVLSNSAHVSSGGIGITTHYISSVVGRFYAVVSWLNNTSDHEVVCSVPGYYKEFGSSSPGYVITVNGQDYTCPVTLGLMFGFVYDIEIGSYHSISSEERLRFDSWEVLPSGSDVGAQNFTISVNRFDTGYDLLSSTEHYLTVTSSYGTTSGSGWYETGSNAYAGLDTGVVSGGTGVQYVFTNWSGDATGSSYAASDSILMNGPKTATADWKTQYYLTVQSDHGTPSGAGWKDSGSSVYAALDTGVVSGGTGVQYVFTNWSGDSTGTNYASSDSILMDGPKTGTAVWKTQYYLTVQSDHANPSGGGWKDAGISATAHLDAGVVAGDTGTQYVFTFWSGDATGSNYASSDSILMNGPKTATANWKTQYMLTIQSDHGTPSGGGWKDSGTSAYASLDASVVSGGTGIQHVFTNWGGDATGLDYSGSDAITMDGPKTATANWITQYYLTVESDYATTSGEGWKVSGSSVFAGLDSGTVSGGTGVQHVFTSWGGDATGSSYASSNSILMDGPKTATANWQTQYYLTVESDHGTPSGEGWKNSGAIAYASLDTGVESGGTGVQYVFTNWSGDSTGTNYASSDSILMEGPRTAAAVWKTQYYLTVESDYANPSGDGWKDAGISATAHLDAGVVAGGVGIQYVFTSWLGDATGTNYAISDSILMNGPKTATANWKTQYMLTIESDHGTPSGGGWKDSGTSAYASLDTGVVSGGTGTQYVFTNWGGAATGAVYSNSDAILMDGPKTATANWITQHYLTVQSDHATTSGEGWKASGSSVYAGLDTGTVSGGTGIQYSFTRWSGDATGPSYASSDSILMDGPKTATANWKTQYYLTVESDYGTSSGEGWKDSGASSYAGLDSDIASGGTGVQYVFTNWGGDATGTDYSVSDSILMDGPKTATASWKTQYLLTVVSDHGTTSGDGWKDAGSTSSAALDTGLVSGGSGIQYLFTSWSGDATGTDYSGSNSILMDGPKTASANWQTQYYLTVTSAYGTPGGEGWKDEGTSAFAGLDSDSVSGGTGIQHVFIDWSGDASGTDYSVSDSITMDGPRTATANWQTQFHLAVISAHGITSGEGWYASGAIAYAGLDSNVIPVAPGERVAFISWGENATGSDYSQSDSILMDNPKTATANWENQFLLSATSEFGVLSGEGWYGSGSVGHMSLDSGVVPGDTGTRYVFISWGGNATGTDYSQSDDILMNGPMNVTTTWQTEHHLTIETAHGTPSGSGWYTADSIAIASLDTDTVLGVTGTKYVFIDWTGDAGGSDYSQSDGILMDGPKTVTANWQTEHYLTVATAQATPSGEGWYASDTEAHAGLDAAVVSGGVGERFVFANWSGDASGIDFAESDTILMDGPKNATAVWKTQYHLTVTSSPDDFSPRLTIAPYGEWFDEGASVDLSAPEIEGYTFGHWVVDGDEYESGVSSITLVMDEAHIAIANYIEETMTTTTTTTDTTTTGTATPQDPLIAAILTMVVGGGGAIVVVVVLIVFLKKRNA